MIQNKIKDISAPVFGCAHALLDIAGVGTLLGGAGAAISGVTSLFSGDSSKKQYNYQQKLNATQQKYAEHNASVAYERQRELTRDTVGLQKKGMHDAGLSTAGMTGPSSTPSVNQASPSSGGTAPDGSVDQKRISDTVSSFISASKAYADWSSTLSENMKRKAETDKIIQDTTQQAESFGYQLKKLKGEADMSESRAAYQKELTRIYESTGMRIAAAEARQAEADAVSKEAAATFAYETTVINLKKSIEELENLKLQKGLTKAKINEIDANIKLLNSKLLTEVTTRSLNLAYAGQANAMTKGIILDNSFKESTFDARKQAIELGNEGKVLSNIGQKFINGGLFLSNEFAKKTFNDRAEEIKNRNENTKSNTGYVNSLKSGQDVKNLFDAVTFGDRANEIHHRSNLTKLKGAYLLKKMNDGSEIIYNDNDDDGFSFNVGNLLKKSIRLGFKSLKYLPRR